MFFFFKAEMVLTANSKLSKVSKVGALNTYWPDFCLTYLNPHALGVDSDQLDVSVSSKLRKLSNLTPTLGNCIIALGNHDY